MSSPLLAQAAVSSSSRSSIFNRRSALVSSDVLLGQRAQLSEVVRRPRVIGAGLRDSSGQMRGFITEQITRAQADNDTALRIDPDQAAIGLLALVDGMFSPSPLHGLLKHEQQADSDERWRGLAAHARSAVKHRPADVVPQPLVIEHELANRLRELVTLPSALESPCGIALAFRRGSTCGLDRIGGRTEFVRGDVCDGPRLASSVRGMPCCATQVSGRAHCMAARRASLHHLYLATHPGASVLDRFTWSWVLRLNRLEQVKDVLRARRRPKSCGDDDLNQWRVPPRRSVMKRGSRTFGRIIVGRSFQRTGRIFNRSVVRAP